MTPAALRAAIASARLRPRMYGPTPLHLAGYLHGMIAGAAPSGANVNAAWCEAYACADPQRMTDAEACDAADATVAALWSQGDDAATEAEARTALDALHARCDAAEADAAAAETLAAKLGDLLRATADALKGPPPPLGLHSTHDLPEVAAEMRRRDELSSAIVGLNESIKEQHIERARALDRFRGQTCYTANVARRLLPSLETHGADGWPLDRVAADALAAEVERLRAEVADAQPVLLLDAIRRGPPSDDIAFPDSERRPVTVSHVEHRTAPPFAIEVDRDHCPTCGALDLDHSPEECARRWAAEHPYAAGAMHGGIAHRSEVPK